MALEIPTRPTKCALNVFYIFCSFIYYERQEKFFAVFYIAKILIVLNLTKVERGKLKCSLRIALWVKSKMAATMEGEWVLDLPDCHFTV